MRITYPSLLLLALTMASCGGGGNAPALSQGTGTQTGGTANAPQGGTSGAAPITPSTGGLIEYYGDSTIWGCQSGSADCSVQVQTPAPRAFGQQMPTKYQVDGSQNGGSQGVSGTTACELRDGTDGLHPVWSKQMEQSQAKYVIMNFGINDAINPAKKYPVTTYTACLHDLAQTARQYGKQVVFETPNPVSEAGLDPYVQAMRQVAASEQAGLIDEYAYLTNYMSSQQKTINDIAPDGTHPSQDVYILKGKYAASEFLKRFP